MRSDRRGPLRRTGGVMVAVTLAAGLLRAGAAGPVFYPDDPIAEDRDTLVDASGARRFELGSYANFAENTFFAPGDRRDIRAMNVNTLDEVPHSSWFTNRIGAGQMSIDEIVRGPDRVDRLGIDEWLIIRDKSTGLQAGFRAVDPSDPTRQVYQLEFDPPGHPEMATGAEIIGTAIYHALGYNVVDVYLVSIDPKKLRISDQATIRGLKGRRPFVQADLDAVLRKAASGPGGRYRALASRFADGAPMGQFRYHGTRPDDPNDIYPHEHRRELRANRVFCAWLNHDDSRANNTLDMLVGPEGRQYIRHYMFDFGSILGSGTQGADSARSGSEYILDARPALATLATLGLYVRPWLNVRYPRDVSPAVGRFEGDAFEPEKWKPEYPNVAFQNLRSDDAFWGARRVAAFSDEAIRAVVQKAGYTDPRATEYLAATLMKRRDTIVRTWLTGVNPVVNVALSAEGALTFDNAAVNAGAETSGATYFLAWARFDNSTGRHTPVSPEMKTTDTRTQAPPAVLAGSEYIAVTIRAIHPRHRAWAQPVHVYFRRAPGGWTTVGLERAVGSGQEAGDRTGKNPL